MSAKEFIIENPRYPQYAVFDYRLKSFLGWPNYLKHMPENLALAGFFYTGTKDRVKCFYCSIGLRNWEPDDDPWIEHARWCETCPYLTKCKGQDFVQLVKESVPVKKKMDFHDASYRLKSFRDAKSPLAVPRQSFAESGFYLFKKNTDHVKCFYCGVELRYWKEGDNPWIEHAKARKTCQYLLQVKGSDFIEKALQDDLEEDANPYGKENPNPNHQITQEEFLEVMNSVAPQSLVDDGNTSSSDNQEKQCLQNAPYTDKTTEHDGPLSEQGFATLSKENQQLKDKILCKICLDAEVKILFLPCGHLCTCAQCAPAMAKCPICRTKVSGTAKILLRGQ